MSDRQLLKKAALVAGHEIVGFSESSAYIKQGAEVVQWSPLDDSGDAFRLDCKAKGLDPAMERRKVVLAAVKASKRAFTCFKCETHTSGGDFKTINSVRSWFCTSCQEDK